jgi:hypothetical protein
VGRPEAEARSLFVFLAGGSAGRRRKRRYEWIELGGQIGLLINHKHLPFLQLQVPTVHPGSGSKNTVPQIL